MKTSRDSVTFQTHNAVSILGNLTSPQAGWIDCNGYADIAVTMSVDAATTSYAYVQWSNDGTNVHAAETIIAASTVQQKAGSLSIKARWAKVNLNNGDAAAHTMSAWAYLKS